jgi:hypothetical protein
MQLAAPTFFEYLKKNKYDTESMRALMPVALPNPFLKPRYY